MCDSCGCTHKSHKLKVDIPIEQSKTQNKKIAPKKGNPYTGDFY